MVSGGGGGGGSGGERGQSNFMVDFVVMVRLC